MIKFTDLSQDKPYKVFKSLYERALDKKQKSIEAFSISTFNQDTNIVDSRFVNLKYIKNDEWIFFTNYNSEKAQAFASHPQVSILFFWNSISTQIRIKAKIFKTSKKISDEHFAARTEEKNALAISSRQSKKIQSFDDVKANYLLTLENKSTLLNRPNYWGGFSFIPYSFEFWEGNKFRLNKRTIYEKNDEKWNNFILQP